MLPLTDTVLFLLPLRSAHPDHGAAVRTLNSLLFRLLLSHFCISYCSPIAVVLNLPSRVFVRFHCTIPWISFHFFHGLIYPFHLFHSQPLYTSFHLASFISIHNIATVLSHKTPFSTQVRFLIAERIISSVFPLVLLSHVFFWMTVIW